MTEQSYLKRLDQIVRGLIIAAALVGGLGMIATRSLVVGSLSLAVGVVWSIVRFVVGPEQTPNVPEQIRFASTNREHRRIVNDVGLVAVTACNAFGAHRHGAVVVLIGAEVLGLAAWDVDRFQAHLAGVSRVDDPEKIVRRHAQKLLLTLVCGASIAAVTYIVRISVPWPVVALLGAVAVCAIAVTVRAS